MSEVEVKYIVEKKNCFILRQCNRTFLSCIVMYVLSFVFFYKFHGVLTNVELSVFLVKLTFNLII